MAQRGQHTLLQVAQIAGPGLEVLVVGRFVFVDLGIETGAPRRSRSRSFLDRGEGRLRFERNGLQVAMRSAQVYGVALGATTAATTAAQADDDGYCQRVAGVAAADAALGLAPPVEQIELQGELGDVGGQLQEAQGVIEANTAHIAELNQTLEARQKSIDGLNADVSDRDTRIADLEGRFSASQQTVADRDGALTQWLPEKDRHVLAAAIALKCNALITGDKTHFGSGYGKQFGGVLILSPRMAAEQLL